MDRRLAALVLLLTSGAALAWRFLVNSLRTQIVIPARTYRPEKYYMRGPGPKWREKHSLQ
jgi:hypothetical protein